MSRYVPDAWRHPTGARVKKILVTISTGPAGATLTLYGRQGGDDAALWTETLAAGVTLDAREYAVDIPVSASTLLRVEGDYGLASYPCDVQLVFDK